MVEHRAGSFLLLRLGTWVCPRTPGREVVGLTSGLPSPGPAGTRGAARGCPQPFQPRTRKRPPAGTVSWANTCGRRTRWGPPPSAWGEGPRESPPPSLTAPEHLSTEGAPSPLNTGRRATARLTASTGPPSGSGAVPFWSISRHSAQSSAYRPSSHRTRRPSTSAASW